MTKRNLTGLFSLLLCIPSYATEPSVTILERVMVIGTPEKAAKIPGSAHFIDSETLKKHHYTDLHRVLQQVPGVNIQEEEGYGNRPNIGIRGGRSERSADITLMEDGILIAPAPYAAASAYYTPRVSRMQAMEVRKGSSTIKFGPRTTSGVVNFVSRAVPTSSEGNVLVGYGANDTSRLQFNVGGPINERAGFVLDVTHDASRGFKSLDSGGDTGFSVQDIMGKFHIHTDPSKDIYQEIELKLGKTREESDETYLGLTDSDFDANPLRRYAASQNDKMQADHEQYQLRHYMEPAENWDVTTTAYYNAFQRNWYKLQSVNDGSSNLSLGNGLNSASHLAVLKGQTNSTADALTVRANNRTYKSYGIQSNVGVKFELANLKHALEFGARFHRDEEDRFQHEDGYRINSSGDMTLTSIGAPGSNANRIGQAKASAFFVQDQISFNQWTVEPGLRYENIRLRRVDHNSQTVFENTVNAFMPGLGVQYEVNETLNLLAGVHKGFSPPSPPSGSTTQTDNEESINYEAGFRYHNNALKAELIGFFTDYDNLLGEETLSSGGGSGSGDQFNGGEVDVFGVETGLSYDFQAKEYKFPFTVNYSFTKAEFQNNFSSDFSEWGTVTAGDELPYIPQHQLFVSLGIAKDKWTLDLSGKYLSEMRTSAGSGEITASDGTDEYFILDLAAHYALSENMSAFLTIDNLTDLTYVAARRPAGARPGKPQTFFVGLTRGF